MGCWGSLTITVVVSTTIVIAALSCVRPVLSSYLTANLAQKGCLISTTTIHRTPCNSLMNRSCFLIGGGDVTAPLLYLVQSENWFRSWVRSLPGGCSYLDHGPCHKPQGFWGIDTLFMFQGTSAQGWMLEPRSHSWITDDVNEDGGSWSREWQITAGITGH